MICNPDNFHIEIPVHTRTEEYARPHVVELCQSTQFSLKLALAGIGSPLQISFAYRNATTKAYMSKKDLIQLQGFFEVFISKKNPNPQANIPDEAKKRNEKAYTRGRPPTVINISSNEQNLVGVPFSDEYVFITLDCKDQELFDDTILEITAIAKYGIGETQVQKAKDNKKNKEKKLTVAEEKAINKTLNEYLVENEGEARKANSLLQFKKNINSTILGLINDRDGDEYKKFMKEVNKKRRVQKSSINDEVFLTGGAGEVDSPRNTSPQRTAGAGDEGSQQAVSIDLASHL